MEWSSVSRAPLALLNLTAVCTASREQCEKSMGESMCCSDMTIGF